MTVVGSGTSPRHGLAQKTGKIDFMGKTAGLDDSNEPSSPLSPTRCPTDGRSDHGEPQVESFRTKSATAKFARTTGIYD